MAIMEVYSIGVLLYVILTSLGNNSLCHVTLAYRHTFEMPLRSVKWHLAGKSNNFLWIQQI